MRLDDCEHGGTPAERNPLYGRQTGIYDIGPLPLRDSAKFFPGYSAQDAITAYAIFGGIPYYLESCDPEVSLAGNITEALLARRSKLADEPTNLLKSETRGAGRFYGILHAFANGCTKSSEIRNRVRAGGEAHDIGWYLDRLRALRVIRVERSLEATERERDRRYVIDDPLTAFWFRFVQPNVSSIARGLGDAVCQNRVAPYLNDYMGNAYEEICRDHVRLWAQDFLGSPARDIGKIWSADYDIDVAGELLDGSFVFGECNWTNQVVNESLFDHLLQCVNKSRKYGVRRRSSSFLAVFKKRLHARTEKAGTKQRVSAPVDPRRLGDPTKSLADMIQPTATVRGTPASALP